MGSASRAFAASASLGTTVAEAQDERPRYALQRVRANSLRELPAQILLERARSEGAALHRARAAGADAHDDDDRQPEALAG
jgi:hypothetical protein